MARRPSSIPGRGLLFLLAAILALLAFYDLRAPASLLRSGWHSVFSRETPVEEIRDEMIDRLGIPR
jgi:hypothetical protein